MIKSSTHNFEFLLFSIDKNIINAATKADIDGIIIDLEYKNKHRRQNGMNTQINTHSINDIKDVKTFYSGYLIVRINNYLNIYDLKNEIEAVINLGANEILLPMVKDVHTVKRVLELINKRVELSILIETKDAISAANELGHLPLKRVYIGLNDLAIELGNTNIFKSLESGIIDSVRPHIKQSFGFAGLTKLDKGDPIPSRLILSELIRLKASFTFLRRSFLNDNQLHEYYDTIKQLRMELKVAKSEHQLEQNRIEINKYILNSNLSLVMMK